MLWKPLVNPADLRGFGEVRLMPSGHKCHDRDFFNAKAGEVLSVYCLIGDEQQDQHWRADFWKDDTIIHFKAKAIWQLYKAKKVK